MANIFLREPTYITVQEVRDTTSKADLIALTDDEIKVLIAKSEDLIDWYIESYGTPFDENQNLIFPIKDEDWNSYIPDDIKVATFYTVEQVFSNWDTISTATITWSWEVKSEKVWDRLVTYEVWVTSVWWTSEQLWIPLEAQNILVKYKKVFYKQTL